MIKIVYKQTITEKKNHKASKRRTSLCRIPATNHKVMADAFYCFDIIYTREFKWTIWGSYISGNIISECWDLQYITCWDPFWRSIWFNGKCCFGLFKSFKSLYSNFWWIKKTMINEGKAIHLFIIYDLVSNKKSSLNGWF